MGELHYSTKMKMYRNGVALMLMMHHGYSEADAKTLVNANKASIMINHISGCGLEATAVELHETEVNRKKEQDND